MLRSTTPLALVALMALACPKEAAAPVLVDAGASEDELRRERILDDALKGLQCPAGTRKVGDEPPVGQEAWCEKGEGVREGPYRAWHKDGTKSVVGQYLVGQRDGAWAEWHPNGQRKNEMSYREGKPNGRFTEWDDNGDVTSRGVYENGRLKGAR
ncbi:MAG: hypothetical protein A2138_20955 [Deltaproteobacteria bacterium RBG_16_71_12]|nr:MAG: hypothetical protein A2138_20955 [Deltaproteobacteria bacterium RBG_16_71_12]